MPTYGLYGAYYNGYFNDNPSWFATQSAFGSDIRTDFTRWTFQESPLEETEESTNGLSIQYTGYFTSSATGIHTFELGSDDAGYFWIGPAAESGFNPGNALINLNGIHGYYTGENTITLTQGVPYFVRIQVGNQPAGYPNPGELSLGYKLPGQSNFTYNAAFSNVYSVQQPTTPTPTPTSTLSVTPTPTPTISPTPTPTSTPTTTPTPIPPYGYFTRRNNQITTYSNLTAVFAAYQGTRTKAAITGLSAGGVDLRDLLDPAIAADEKITFNTGFSVNGVDLKDIFRAEGIEVTPTPTPTPTSTGTPLPTNTPTPTPTPTQVAPPPTPPPPPPPPPTPPSVNLTVNGSVTYGSTINFSSFGNGNTQLINTHIIWERSGSDINSLGVWIANYSTTVNAFVSNLTNVGSFTISFYGVYQFYANIYTNGGLYGYGSQIQTYYVNP